MICILLNLLRLVFCPVMLPIFENVPCALEKNVYFVSLKWKALYISFKSIWSKTLFNVAISLLIFFGRSVHFCSGVLKSPIMIVLLSISFLKFSKIFFCVWVLLCWGHIYSQWLCLLNGFFPWVLWSDLLGPYLMSLLLKSILSDMSIATLAFFPFHFLGIFVSSPSL